MSLFIRSTQVCRLYHGSLRNSCVQKCHFSVFWRASNTCSISPGRSCLKLPKYRPSQQEKWTILQGLSPTLTQKLDPTWHLTWICSKSSAAKALVCSLWPAPFVSNNTILPHLKKVRKNATKKSCCIKRPPKIEWWDIQVLWFWAPSVFSRVWHWLMSCPFVEDFDRFQK